MIRNAKEAKQKTLKFAHPKLEQTLELIDKKASQGMFQCQLDENVSVGLRNCLESLGFLVCFNEISWYRADIS